MPDAVITLRPQQLKLLEYAGTQRCISEASVRAHFGAKRNEGNAIVATIASLERLGLIGRDENFNHAITDKGREHLRRAKPRRIANG